MMAPAGMDVESLDKFLNESGVPRRGALQVELISGGRSDLTYRAFDDDSTWVVRRPPTSGLTPTAHDMAREWAVINALGPTDVPVARAVAFDPDGKVLGAPMTVVEHIAGTVVRSRDDLAKVTDDEIVCNAGELVRVLARLHAVDYHDVGLGNFGRPAGFARRQVSTWVRQWDRVKTRELRDVERLRDQLTATAPDRSESSIVHGDYRIDNVILTAGDTGTVAAVVDWEMSTLGDPLTDIALMCVYRQSAFDVVLGMDSAWTSERYPSADAIAGLYADEAGRELTQWGFYTALANFKVAVIAEGITHRSLTGSESAQRVESAAEATREFLAAGLRAIRL